jgi:hypothetical protein
VSHHHFTPLLHVHGQHGTAVHMRQVDSIFLQKETEEKARQPETNLTHTARSKATQRQAKPNQKPKTHIRGSKQASTTSAKGQARPRIGVWPEARVVAYAPGRHRDALPREGQR